MLSTILLDNGVFRGTVGGLWGLAGGGAVARGLRVLGVPWRRRRRRRRVVGGHTVDETETLRGSVVLPPLALPLPQLLHARIGAHLFRNAVRVS